MSNTAINIRVQFDEGRADFIEIETDDGASVSIGKFIPQADGTHLIRITVDDLLGVEGHKVYSVGDADPTPDDTDVDGYCEVDCEPSGICTWPKGHTHPQHVAGTGNEVVGVSIA